MSRAAADPAKTLTRNEVLGLFDKVTVAVTTGAELGPEDVTLLRAMDGSAEQPFVAANRTIYTTMHALPAGKVKLDALFAAAEGLAPGAPLAEAAAYLAFHHAAERHARAHGLDKVGVAEWVGHAPALEELLDAVERKHPAGGAHLVNRAKVASLTDRTAAAERLAEANAAAPLFMAALNYDFGAGTYLSEADLAAHAPDWPGEAEKAALATALGQRATRYAGGAANLLFSADPRFLRIHGPPWFEILPYLMTQGLRPVFVIAGPVEEAELVIAESRALIEAIARYRGDAGAADAARSASFVRVDVPAFVSEPLTFYATLRHLMAGAVIEATGLPALVLDVDMTVKDAFAPTIATAKGWDVGAPFTRGLPVLSPWRRYMAGTDWFNATDASLAFLEALRRYILIGHARRPSWMLDQNALTWALETGAGGARVLNMNTAKRPAGQDAIRKPFERTFP